MTTEVTEYNDGSDDGFGGSLNSSDRIIKGLLLKWNDTLHWHDRDGLQPPNPLLAIAVNEILQRWQGKQVSVITAKPLPDPDVLNSAIPVKEWEIGLDGKPRPPWQHVVVVYLVNLATGEVYTFMNSTVGAHMAYDHLKEAVIVMRQLRGTKPMPLVNLDERPMKTTFGMKTRPHFEIIGWKSPGDDNERLPAQSTPQLTGPAAAAAATPTPAPPAATPRELRPHPIPEKPAVNLTADTLSHMAEVKPVSIEEELNDELPW
jgi:hypothetical protein